VKRTRTAKTIIVQTTAEMDNWMHPQNTERKLRIKDRMMAAAERVKQMRKEIPDKV
jgi:hypothetical protein